jgi:RHS repeat-associated protein
MWHSLCASRFAYAKRVDGYAGVVRDLLQARYYDSGKGEFLSEDPVFLGDPKQQALSDPQSLNSYSYANDNPITKSDPNGRCVGPLVAVCIAGGVGAIGGVAFQAYSDYQSGDFSNRSWEQNMKTYGVAATEGAVAAVGVATAALLAPEGIAGTVVVGGTAGVMNAGTTYGGNYLLGQNTDLTNLALSSGLSALTAGTLKTLPQAPGRLPNFATQAFYAGAHTQRQAAEELFSNSVQAFSQSVSRFVSTQNYSVGASRGGGSGGGSYGSLVQQLQSLASSLQSYVSGLRGSKSSAGK